MFSVSERKRRSNHMLPKTSLSNFLSGEAQNVPEQIFSQDKPGMLLIPCYMCSLCDHEGDTPQLERLLLPPGLDWTGLGWSHLIVKLTNWSCCHFVIEFIQCFQMMWWFRKQIISHSCDIYACKSFSVVFPITGPLVVKLGTAHVLFYW